MKNDNRGFTLTELIVGIAIFAIVAAAAYGFMIAGANSYAGSSDRLSRQLRSQMAFSQIENRLIDCDAAVSTANGKLYIVNRNTADNTKYDIYAYELKDSVLYFGKAEGVELSTLSATSVSSKVSATKVLAQKVASFSSEKKLAEKNDKKVVSVSVTLALQTRTGASAASYTQTVALRNTPQPLT